VSSTAIRSRVGTSLAGISTVFRLVMLCPVLLVIRLPRRLAHGSGRHGVGAGRI
jgi:hypothetical protein